MVFLYVNPHGGVFPDSGENPACRIMDLNKTADAEGRRGMKDEAD